MNIHPRPDQELAIQEAIRAGLINNEIDALDIGLEILKKILRRNFPKAAILSRYFQLHPVIWNLFGHQRKRRRILENQERVIYFLMA
ncbi:MAG: hypothetical protein ABSB19_05220 [Methylomonas sp.]|jgi:hypothetical protein